MNTDVLEMKTKFFSLANANASLVYVSKIVQDIQLQFEIVTALRQGDDRNLFEAGMDILNELIDELAEVGCQLTDFEEGQVLFPGVYNGKHVEFRWKLGDTRIRGYTCEGSNHLRRINYG